MKNINFHKVEMENFCGYTDPMEFTFENSKITLISGKNGVGKSTVFSAIPFALYGITQTGQTATDVLNNKTEKNCLVKCYFSIDDAKYTAVRGLKSPKASTSAFLFVEGTRDPIAKGAREVTAKIEDLIVPKELFLNTILFGQKVKSFFTDLPDSKQKEIFRKILQLDAYVDYQKLASEKIIRMTEETDGTNRNIDKMEASIESLQYNISKIDEIIKEKELLIKDFTHLIGNLNDEKEVNEKYITSLDENGVIKEQELLIEQNNNFKNELTNLEHLKKSQISELSATISSKIAQLKETYSNEVHKLNDTMNNQIMDITAQSNDTSNIIANKISSLREDYLTEKNDISNQYNSDITNLTKTIQNKKDIVRETIDKFKELCKSDIDVLFNDFNIKKQNIVDLYEKHANDRNDQIEHYKEEIQQIALVLNTEKNKFDISQEKIKEYQKSIDSHSSICPMCHQVWKDNTHIEAMLEMENKTITQSKSLLSDLDKEIKLLQNKIADIKNDNIEIGLQHTQQLEKMSEIFEIDKKKIEDECDNKIAVCMETHEKEMEEFDKTENHIKENLQKSLSELDERFKKIADRLKKDKKDNEEKLVKVVNKIRSEVETEIEKFDERLAKAIDTVESMKNDKLVELCSSFEEKSNDIGKKLLVVENEITNIKHRLAAIESAKNKLKVNIDEIKYHTDRREQCLKDIEDNNKINIETRDKIDQYMDNIKQLNNHIKDIKKDQEICKFWKSAFSSSGIPSMLIDESIPFMNKRISNYLEQMSNGRYIVSFDTLHETKSGEFRDKISVNVYDAETHSNSRVNLSGGQTKLVDIATILTLSDLQESVQKFKTNILLFDEIFDALDDDNIANVSNMLRRIIKDKSINIITHRHIDQVEADAVYNFGN